MSKPTKEEEYINFSPLAKPIKVDGYSITTPVRNGFTVVEWGGVLR